MDRVRDRLQDQVTQVAYHERLKAHLAEFKRRRLGIREPGEFRYRGRVVLYEHILPKAAASANLFEEAEPAANAFFSAHPRKRHRYFHHLNSSQAFAFNLFFPYFHGTPESASALLRALGREGILTKWEPEAVPVPSEASTIDVFWATADGVRTFCEVKLSERDFGKAKDDAPHRNKLRDIYEPVLANHMESRCLDVSAFLAAYQFNRNLWHMVRDDRSRLVFLLPRANAGLWARLHALLSGVVRNTRHRISAVAMEDVIVNLTADDQCPEPLRRYACKFGEKYIADP